MIRIKANDFLKMNDDQIRELHEKTNTHMHSMWQCHFASSTYTDDQVLIIHNDHVVYKTGRTIDGVQMTDESCSYYEKQVKNRYIDAEGNYAGSSVNDVCRRHC